MQELRKFVFIGGEGKGIRSWNSLIRLTQPASVRAGSKSRARERARELEKRCRLIETGQAVRSRGEIGPKGPHENVRSLLANKIRDLEMSGAKIPAVSRFPFRHRLSTVTVQLSTLDVRTRGDLRDVLYEIGPRFVVPAAAICYLFIHTRLLAHLQIRAGERR